MGSAALVECTVHVFTVYFVQTSSGEIGPWHPLMLTYETVVMLLGIIIYTVLYYNVRTWHKPGMERTIEMKSVEEIHS